MGTTTLPPKPVLRPFIRTGNIFSILVIGNTLQKAYRAIVTAADVCDSRSSASIALFVLRVDYAVSLVNCSFIPKIFMRLNLYIEL